MFSRRNAETGIFNKFKKIVDAGLSAKQMQRNSCGFYHQRNGKNFLDAIFNETKKYTSFKSLI